DDEQGVEVALAYLAHVADAESGRLPVAVAAADGVAALGAPLDDRLRIDARRREEAADGDRAGVLSGSVLAAAGGRPGGGLLLQPLVAGPARLHTLGDHAVKLDVERPEERDGGGRDEAPLLVLVDVAQEVGVEA